jgi:hypothetical protein
MHIQIIPNDEDGSLDSNFTAGDILKDQSSNTQSVIPEVPFLHNNNSPRRIAEWKSALQKFVNSSHKGLNYEISQSPILNNAKQSNINQQNLNMSQKQALLRNAEKFVIDYQKLVNRTYLGCCDNIRQACK